MCLACSACARPSDLGPVRDDGRPPGPTAPDLDGRQPDLEQARFFARAAGTRDEAELELSAFDLAVHISGATARSRLAVGVRNPAPRDMEAVLRVPIPPGAAVTEAILYIDDQPMRGSFVDRDRAKAIYTGIVERRRDPLLAVWSGPDWIDVTIFPVPGGSERKFELEWVEPLGPDGDQAFYRVPILAHRGTIVGAPETGTIDGRALALDGRRWISLAGSRGRVVAGRMPGDPFGYVMAPGRPLAAAPRRMTLIAETSAAMSREDRALQRQQLETLLDGTPRGTSVTLLAADWLTEALVEDGDASAALAALDRLDAIPSLGALDLERALASAIERAEGATAIVYLGHGADRFAGDPIEMPLSRLRARKLPLVAVGDSVAPPLADASWLSGGRVMSTDRPEFREVMRALASAPPRADAPAPIDGWFPLETVTGEVVWIGRQTGQAPARAGKADGRDLSALWARSRFTLTPERRDRKEPEQEEVEAAPELRVLTPLSSLLVLESEAEFRRFGIRRDAIEIKRYDLERDPPDQTAARARSEARQQAAEAGVLGVLRAQDGSGLSSRATSDWASGLDNDVYGGLLGNEVGEMQGAWGYGMSSNGMGGGGTGLGTIGLGRYGTIGHGVGTGAGYGYGYGGRGFGESGRARRADPPSAAMGAVTVEGALDKSIVRRYLRRSLAKAQYCYEKELLVDPSLAGSVTVDFTIDATGRVISALAKAKGLEDSEIGSCVRDVVRTIQFPMSDGGGVVNVQVPFVFRSAGATAVESRWDRALAESSVAEMAEIVDAPATERADVLAWWLVEQLHAGAEPSDAYVLAARLFRDAGQDTDARRILSEAAATHSRTIERELRRLKQDADADRLVALRSSP